MQLAILGTRGVPARYGGFETFSEELGARLAERGHQVTVYGRTKWVSSRVTSHRGITVVRLPAPDSKYLETVVHTLFSAFHALPRQWDIVYVCNLANVPAAIVLVLAGKRVVMNVDGLEWKRVKWNALGRAYYRACAWMAARLPIEIVTDARVIQDHYLTAYGRETRFFPYGTDLETIADDGTLGQLGLEPGRYVLYVSRLEPENNAHVVIEGFANVASDLALAIVGDAPYAGEYIARLRSAAAGDPRVRMVGAVYGDGYRVLRSNAAAYVQATEVGGTHPALVEAMGSGNAIAANDVPEHREVLADAGLYYSGPAALGAALQRLLDDRELAADLGRRARRRAREMYSWDAVAAGYEDWLHQLAVGR